MVSTGAEVLLEPIVHNFVDPSLFRLLLSLLPCGPRRPPAERTAGAAVRVLLLMIFAGMRPRRCVNEHILAFVRAQP